MNIKTFIIVSYVFLVLFGCTEMMDESQYDEVLLEDVSWSFSEPLASNLEGFIEALKRYGEEIEFEVPISDISEPLNFKKAVVTYRYYIEIESGNASDWIAKEESISIVGISNNLTEIEMLYLIHQEAHKHLKDQDGRYFEGLELIGTEEWGPKYEVILGS